MSETSHPTTLDRVRDLINIFGSDTQRWPEDERDAIQTFIATSPDAQSLHKEARELDAALDSLPQPKLSAELRQSVFNLQRTPMPVAANENDGFLATIVHWYPQSNGSWFRAAAAAVVFGILCGVGVSQVFGPPSTVVIAQPALPEFVQPVSDELQQGGVATLTLISGPTTTSLETPPQNEETETETGEDPDVPLT